MMSVRITRLFGLAVAMATSAWASASPAQVGAEPGKQPASLMSSAHDLSQDVKQEAEGRGVPPALADALVSVLSGYEADAVGAQGHVGLMQIHPAMARMHGYEGDMAGLRQPETNIRYGMLHFARAWTLAKGDVCLALVKYRTSYAEGDVTPSAAKECEVVKARLAELGSPLASTRPRAAAISPSARSAVPMREMLKEAAAPASAQSSQTEPRSAVVSPRTTIPEGRTYAPGAKEPATKPVPTPHVTATRTPQRSSGPKVESKAAPPQNAPEVAVARIIAGGRTTWQPVRQTRSGRTNPRIWAEHERRLRQIEARISPNVIQIMRR